MSTSDLITDMTDPSDDVDVFDIKINRSVNNQNMSLDEVEADTPLEERLLVDQDLFYRGPETPTKPRTYSRSARRRSNPHIVIERCSQAEEMLKEQSIPLKEITQVRKRRSSRHSLPAANIEPAKRARSDGIINDENTRATRSNSLRSRSCSLGKLDAKESQKDEPLEDISKESPCGETVSLDDTKTNDSARDEDSTPHENTQVMAEPEIAPTDSIKSTPGKVKEELTEAAEEVREEKLPRRSLRVPLSLQVPKTEIKIENSVEDQKPTAPVELKPPETPKGRELRSRSCNATPKTNDEDCSSSLALDSTLDGCSFLDSDESDCDFDKICEEESGSLLGNDDDDDSISWDGEFEKVPNGTDSLVLAKLKKEEDDISMPDSGVALEEPEGLANVKPEVGDELHEFKVGQPVLARLGRWPYWPAFIVPFEGQHIRLGKFNEYHVVFCGQKHLRAWINIKHLVHCETLAAYNSLLENCKERQNPFQVNKKYKNNWKISMDEMMRVKSEDISLILEMYEVKKKEPKKKVPKITAEERQQLKEHLRALKKAEREELKLATKMKRAKMIELKKLRRQKLMEELRRIREEARGHITRNVCFKCRDHNNRSPVVRCSQCDYFYHHTCEPHYSPDAATEAFVCTYCKTATMPCHLCHTHSPGMLMCQVKRCQKLYHATCLDFKWQQASILDNNLISCPVHSCHSCIHRSIVEYKKKIEPREKLVRCTVCPATYHKDEECIPAGAVRINSHQILCPRHTDVQNKPRTYLCQICVKPFTQVQFEGDKVRSCRTCPCLYHLDCLDEEDEQQMAADQFVCIYCRDGYFPRAGDVVWAKCGSSRWWPAKVLARSDYPENMLASKHTPGMFVVRFYGTNDHSWVNNKSTFFLQNEDDVSSSARSSSKDQKFQKGLLEAIQDVQDRELYFDSKVPLHYDSGMDKKPGNYRRIKNNIYVKPCRPLKELEDIDETCKCNPEEPDPCGDGCVNKGLKIECSKECPCKELCQNQRIQRHQNAPTELKHMGTKGWGLTALQDLKQGTFIIEYVGEVLTKEEFQRRKQEYIDKKERHFYFLELSGNHFIDARNKGNLSRFINHSCEPNCESSHWSVLGERRVGLFTLRDVKAGEELTFNYGWRSDGSNNQQCLCGAESCSKLLAMEKLKKASLESSVPSKSKGRVSKGKSRLKKSVEAKESSIMVSCDVCSSNFLSSKESVICSNCYDQQEF